MFLAACFIAAGHACAQQGGDLQARILYAFHSEDSNELSALIQTLATKIQGGSEEAGMRYHLAHAEYRSGLLAGAARAREAESAFAECTEQLKLLLKRDAGSVEALVLQSACYSNLAHYTKLGAGLMRSLAAARLDAALKIEPNNPRALYVEAVESLHRGPRGSSDAALALDELRRAAAAFESTSATRTDVPGWGHAEAYLELGRRLQARGDVLGARNWMEKALIMAPDYKAAQRQLGTLMPHDAGGEPGIIRPQ